MSNHTEWLSLVEVSGPFLSVPALEKAFPQGLESVETPRRTRLRSAYEEWGEAIDNDDSLIPEIHREWIWMVITELLEYDSYSLIPNSDLELPYSVTSPERTGIYQPNWVVKINQDEKPRLFISVLPPGTSLEAIEQDDCWPNSFIERMTLLCRTNDVRLGLITNGERWVLINAPSGDTSSHTSWYSRLWFQEPITLKAFQSLLGVRRCFASQEETLEALLEESLKHLDDVTDTLGEQVRHAVEVLIQSLDKADQDRNRKLLLNVTSAELYEAGLTVMMRLVFLLCAEERGLLLLGDPFYDQHYAISTLRSQLVEEADRHGPELLERRYDAWARLLAVFRMIFGGIDHESLRMPALGGSLFDPDRFPFLEGRPKGTSWYDKEAAPLPIDNRTVLLMLNSLQVLQQHGGALLLSFRALDVEQIGHVYEGLLEKTVERASGITLGLIGLQKAKNPNISLDKLEFELAKGEQNLINIIKEFTERSETSIRNALYKPVEETGLSRLLAVCGGDTILAKRIQPYLHLVRTDAWNDPIVYLENAFIVTNGIDRRESGTHYTPKLLTENIVENTLEPLVYDGPSEGKQREQWVLKSSSELLELKICDPAMGSGAFLVQTCRWLAERLVERWAMDEQAGKVLTISGEVQNDLAFNDPMPKNLNERLLVARRLIAERCLYGVDVNPLAVELSKLSIWLITLSKGRPFGFLDHNLRHGDSLLGINKLEQLIFFSLGPDIDHRQLSFFSQQIDIVISEAIELRKRLREIPIKDIHDVETMSRLDIEAKKKLEVAEVVGDAMVGAVLQAEGNPKKLDAALVALFTDVEVMVSGNAEIVEVISVEAKKALAIHLPENKPPRKTLHWPLEFPEVFIRKNGGFDAIIGNPPFMGGRRMRGILGDAMLNWLTFCWPHASLNADLCAFFYLRSVLLLRSGGSFGLLATKTIGQGDTARTSLSHMIEKHDCSIRYALSSFIWPGNASVVAALVIGNKGKWHGVKILDRNHVEIISPVLDDKEGWGDAQCLQENKKRSFQGSVLRGKGFVLSHDEAMAYMDMREENMKVIWPFLSGDDLNTHPEQKASRWVIDFRDASLEECQKSWPELLSRVQSLVKPERDKLKESDRKNWWKHWRNRLELYDRINNRDEVFVIAAVTKYVAIVSVPAKQVFLNKVYVFDLPSWANFAALQSSFHDIWVRRGSSTLGETLNYTPSDYFDTYPFFNIKDDNLDIIGKRYHEYRKMTMCNCNEGLTAIYNRFHDPEDRTEDIMELRCLHEQLDKSVAMAYGWGDLQLGHGFHETKQGIRYTIDDSAKREVLNRLLKLNQELNKMEISRVIKDKKVAKSAASHRPKKKTTSSKELLF
ncbi:DNA methyltransferase [Paenibacillus polymyxa]|uniref:Eco57I restriction-modification methylase domain-containing protein n=1 Tax=Paenibacillus polymyxa TaxID=1406 RepID=UPI003D2CDA3B